MWSEYRIKSLKLHEDKNTYLYGFLYDILYAHNVSLWDTVG